MDENTNQPVDQVVDDNVADMQPDPIRNLKGEVDRKMGNLSAQIAEQNKRLEVILANVQQSMQANQPAQPQERKPLRELLYEDADQAAALITDRAVRAAEQAINQKFELSQRSQAVVNEVMSNYPEFGQQGSEAASLAIQKAATLPKHLQGTPEGAKMAMLEAAAELGLTPVKARKQSTSSGDDFVVSGQTGGGTGSRPSQRSQDPTKGIPEATLAMAQLLGRDINDPKVLEGLREASKRKDWSRYR